MCHLMYPLLQTLLTVSVMKQNCNAVTLTCDMAEQESWISFLKLTCTLQSYSFSKRKFPFFFGKFSKKLLFRAPVGCGFWKTTHQGSLLKIKKANICSLKFPKNSQENNCASNFFLIHLQAYGKFDTNPSTLLKRDAGIGNFLWVLPNF